MKDSHIYQRMSNPSVIKTYVHMINTYSLDTVVELYNNITAQADDHPRYDIIKQSYEARLLANKE
jgi:hypothetical protein